MNYSESIDWLYGTQTFGIKLGLDNTHRLLHQFVETLPPPAGGSRVVHVAGTNGKGSVCAFCDRILRDAGLQVGLFTSPHLVSFRERIQLNGEWIPESDVATILTEIREGVADWDLHPTFFEITLALAMRWFRSVGCEAIILETGMGGRLDATNAVASNVSVITSISLDHQQWLGDTIAEIAGEKAGILKPEVPAIIANLHPDARDVVGRRALTLRIPCIEAHPIPADWELGLPGPHQRENAALAVEAACRIENDRLTQDGIRQSLADTSWPGRFQEVSERYILDGAHNPEAAEALRQTWEKRLPGKKARLVFGAADSKDAAGILRELVPITNRIVTTPIQSERRLSHEELAEAWVEAGGDAEQIERADSIEEALQADGDELTLVAGSLFLVGEALGYLRGESFEVSLQ